MQVFFQAFLNSGAMASVLDSFCIYHVTAPGQEPGAKDLPDGFVYPNMDELSEQVGSIWKRNVKAVTHALILLIMVQNATLICIYI